MSNPMYSNELRKEIYLLAEAVLRGDASAEDVSRLDGLLQENPAASECYVEYILQSVQLGVWATALGDSQSNSASALQTSIGSAEEDASPQSVSVDMPAENLSLPSAAVSTSSASRQVSASGAFPQTSSRPRPSRWLLTPRMQRAGGLAGMLFVAFLAWSWLSQTAEILAERESQPVASLTASDKARWQGSLKLAKGTRLIEGQQLNLLEGRAQISMSCGAELMLKAPCSLSLSSSDRVLLTNGVLSVQVAGWTKDFTVATNSVEIVDLGKQFVVSADAKTSAVEAHAIDGKIRIQTADRLEQHHRSTLVSSGEAIRIDATENLSARFEANEKLFDSGVNDSRPFKPLPIHNTGQDMQVGDEDPYWRVVGSSDAFKTDQYAIVCVPYKTYYLANDPALSQWISVSTPPYENCPSDTMYTFETEFDLSDYDLSTVTIVAQVLADNGITAMRINGKSIPIKPWIETVKYHVYKRFRPIEITSGFVEGRNTIQFDVWNAVNVVYPAAPNPMALRVEWQAFGRMKQSQDVASFVAAPRGQIVSNRLRSEELLFHHMYSSNLPHRFFVPASRLN